MKSEYIFPSILIIIDLLSAVVYAGKQDWRMVIYWVAAAVLNAAVTFR